MAHPSEVISENLTFEKICSTHCQILAALHRTSFERPWAVDEFEQMLGHTGTGGVIALNAQAVPVGFILLRSVVDEAEILTFCVDPQYRCQKFATRMLKHMVAESACGGMVRIFLEVAEDNMAAIGLYQACGFISAGERPGYYQNLDNTAKNAIIMVHNI